MCPLREGAAEARTASQSPSSVEVSVDGWGEGAEHGGGENPPGCISVCVEHHQKGGKRDGYGDGDSGGVRVRGRLVYRRLHWYVSRQ